MANQREYLERLQMVVEQLHNCKAVHASTVPVHVPLNGQTVWQGDVEVFNIFGNLKAKRCYAWLKSEGVNMEEEGERTVAVLAVPPVDSALKAVQNQLVKEAKMEHPLT